MLIFFPKRFTLEDMDWIKSHKLVIVLIGIIIALFIYASNSGTTYNKGLSNSTSVRPPQALGSVPAPDGSKQSPSEGSRLVIKESTMSLLVSDVVAVENKIVSHAKEAGGYMVNTAYSKQDDLPSARVSIRVPAEKLDSTLSFIRSLGLKVTDENIIGTDVTQDYTDTEARLDTLKQAHAKLQDLLAKSSKPEDILTVQRDLLDIQQQMDDLNGQRKALEQNAKLTKITVYISSDELALPYATDHAFRPDAIFKQAARSMLSTLQFLGQLLIWLLVYSPLIAAGIVLYRLIKKFRNRKKTPSA